MVEKDNTAAQMLLFPVQRTTEDELAACDDTHILYWQARLAITDALNTFFLVEVPSTELVRKNKKLVNDFNTLALEVGYPPLNVQFN
jgi:hypothetical protein